MSISFSVHEFNARMQAAPIYVVGTLWLDAQGLWLLGSDDLPAVEIVDPLLTEALRRLIAPAEDYLARILLYGWLRSCASGWQLSELYEADLKPLDDQRHVWPVHIPLRKIPEIYCHAR